MVIFQGERRFELTIEEAYGAWVARFLGYMQGRLIPTPYLLRTFATRQEAIAALERKWRLLFPDAAALVWREPSLPPARRQSPSRSHLSRGLRR